MIKKLAGGLLLGLWAVLLPVLQAAPLVEINQPAIDLSLAPYIDILEDPDGKLVLEDVISERYAFRFASTPLTELFFGYTSSAYWIRFTVENQKDSETRLVLAASPADIDYLDLYELDPLTKQQRSHRRMGSAINYDQREYDHPLYFFDLKFPPESVHTYYLRVQSNKTVNLQLNLSTPREHQHNTSVGDWWQGLLLGSLLALSIIHAALFVLFRFKGFLWCSLFLLSTLFMQVSLNGYFLQFFNTDHQLLDRQIILPVYLAILFSSLFAQAILETRKRSVWQHGLLTAFAVFSLCAACLTWVIDSYITSISASVFAVLNTIAIFGLSLQANMEGHVMARHFLMVRTFTTAVILTAIFNIHGYLPQGSFAAWGVATMVAVESAFLLTVMAANCLRDLRAQQKVASNAPQDISKHSLINLGDICHELRTPISGILGMTDLLVDGNLTEQQRNQVKTIRKSSQSLLDVANKIADLSSIEHGTVEIKESTFELTALIEACVENCRTRAESSNIELIYHIDAQLPHLVKGDQGKLQQIIINALNFSLRHTEKGEIILNISPGMADEIVFSIRAGSNTLIDRSLSTETRQLSSSDQLNITIAEQYLHLMGSSLSVRHYIGEGSIIEFHVALAEQTQTPSGDKDMTLHGKKILVVDDNATCCAIIEQQAIQWGMSVISAHGGKEALAILRSSTTLAEAFDIVLTDYDMPGMNGLELAKHIHDDEKINSNKLLIVMLTGVSTAPKDMTPENSGIQSILYKPLSGKSLKTALQNALSAHRQPA